MKDHVVVVAALGMAGEVLDCFRAPGEDKSGQAMQK
jgi:hypothetical protein